MFNEGPLFKSEQDEIVLRLLAGARVPVGQDEIIEHLVCTRKTALGTLRRLVWHGLIFSENKRLNRAFVLTEDGVDAWQSHGTEKVAVKPRQAATGKVVPPRTFNFHKMPDYVPDKSAYYRNDGNLGIKSRGLPC